MSQRQVTVKKAVPGAQKSLRNAYSASPKVFATIQSCLAAHKVREVQYTFAEDGSGRYVALNFVLDLAGERRTFRMPARVEAVERVLFGEKTLTPTQRDQAYQTAWANIRDWIISQFALIDTGMAQAEEVFLPYLLIDDGQTLYETLQARRFLLPGAPGAPGADAATDSGSRRVIQPIA